MPRSISKLKHLYPFLLSVVLLLSGCVENSQGINDNQSETEPVRSDKTENKNVKDADNLYRILFLGDSITAGYGIEPENAFPALIQNLIDDLELPFVISDGGLSGDTSAGGLSRISWLLREPVEVLIIELGGNDGLRGIKTDITKQNLARIIEITRETYPEVRIILAGMQVPPNLGHEYTAAFREIYPELSIKYETALIPFILEGVGGNPNLNQPDQIHPTEEGHEIVAHNVWNVLEPILMGYRSQASDLQ